MSAPSPPHVSGSLNTSRDAFHRPQTLQETPHRCLLRHFQLAASTFQTVAGLWRPEVLAPRGSSPLCQGTLQECRPRLSCLLRIGLIQGYFGAEPGASAREERSGTPAGVMSAGCRCSGPNWAELGRTGTALFRKEPVAVPLPSARGAVLTYSPFTPSITTKDQEQQVRTHRQTAIRCRVGVRTGTPPWRRVCACGCGTRVCVCVCIWLFQVLKCMCVNN